MARYRWKIRQTDESKVELLTRELSLHPIVARILVARGYEDPETAYKFLKPSLDDLADPRLLPDASPAVARLARAIEQRERVLIYGDYDVDGVSSAALWHTTLSRLGVPVKVKLPHRDREGYDLHPVAIEEAQAFGAKLVLTCDCGTRAHDVVNALNAHGIEVVITDHHEPDLRLPNAVAVVNPKRFDSQYPYADLSGVGVSFRLAEALLRERNIPLRRFRERMLDLVALGTVADVAPLTGENRILVREGLDALYTTRRKGLIALKQVAGIANRRPTATDIGFRLGPRLNAAGRLDDAIAALELLLTEDDALAEQLASELNRQNAQRQQMEQEAMEEAIRMVQEEEQLRHRALVVASPNWHHGIVGLVAGKLRERFGRPTFAISLEEELGRARGSIRSIPAMDLVPLLQKMKPLCTKCGGHAIAGGFSARIDQLDALRQLIWEYADSLLTDEDLIPALEVDAEVSPEEVDWRLYRDLAHLEPFGQGNEVPVLLCRDLTVISRRTCRNNKHLFLELKPPERAMYVPAVMWNGAEYAIDPQTSLDVVFSIEWDDYTGGLRWELKDFEERL
ncbi:MAG: single-stranded-DNA-specific exonuclease RecJ [Fimbriimonadales bacterium]|jgi:single-stranded-DNA-specific exonuclease|nr:single-stranded-DNA-specific exonuclease RecJ [Fimbriimonadales bacterium]GBC90529.1 Single-stranded-DNA-specific exonuclease RecJ [bacterium HR14]GIV13363.1 MAG: single-stranded-DNA-specific exonuclease RecJ [Fimbriimonadales bacterium]CUU03931.1 single-stranded-DNA-specific exonuclease [Armatimonadetes bacterium GBS]CUU35933.1 single-stranded-DNA-specific exonuclease [Armatimonadetes bacterium GXS]